MTARKATKRANGEGTVYEDRERSRPEARVWRVVVVGPDGRRRSQRVRGSKRAAFDVRDRLRTEAAATATASGLPRPPRGGRTWTVETWLDYWKSTVVAGREGIHGTGLSRSSLRREAWAAGEITRGLGSRPLRSLSVEDVETFLTDRAAGIGVSRRAWKAESCKDVRNLLARAYDAAMKRGHAPAPNPAREAFDGGTPGNAVAAEAQFSLTEDQAQRLYRAAREDGTAPALVLALQLATGMRPGEASRLQWGRVDFDARTLHVAAAKTPDGIRTIHLAPPAVVVLRDALRVAELRARDPEAYVFPGAVRSPHVTPRALIETLERLCGELSVMVDGDAPRLPHPHELRHTFASLLIDAGVPPQRVAGIMGDKVETVLRVYAHKLRAVAGEAEAVHVAALYGEAV